MLSQWIIRSKLAAPRLRPPFLPRPRLDARLALGLEVPLILAQAGAGYGKSTAVSAFLLTRPEPSAWYGMDEKDADPLLFCAHLAATLEHLAPGLAHAAMPVLEQARRGELPWTLALDALNNHLYEVLAAPAWLVLDDVHLLVDGGAGLTGLLDRFLAHTPPDLHVILSSRHWLELPTLTQARARSQVVVLGEAELRLTSAEVGDLFAHAFAIPLTQAQVERLSHETEGWVIALQLLAHQLQGQTADQIEATLADLPGHLGTLFDYLTESVIQRQAPELQAFLYQTAILRQLDPASCNSVRRTQDSAELLGRLPAVGLSLVQVGEDSYRHHHLARAFLQRNLRRDRSAWRTLHRRAAAHFQQAGQVEESVHHLMLAGDYEAAAHQVNAVAPALIETGRIATLAGWLEQMPAQLLDDHPDLWIVRGDVARLTSAYDAALAAYRRAEDLYAAQGDALGRSHALESQALVYVDTVRPAPAEALLKLALRALRRRHPAEGARLLRLLAENACNRGRPGLAWRWYAASQRLQAPPDLELEARIRLRSGQLRAAQALLAPIEQAGRPRPARTHREPSLLLAFLQVLQGDAGDAYASSRRGLELARRLNSPFTEAVALMRLGHALQLPQLAQVEEAAEHYTRAIDLMRLLGVNRGEAEPQFGLALLHAFAGQPQRSQLAGERSLEIAERAEDGWVVGLARLALGINHALNRDAARAETLLLAALAHLSGCDDQFGACLCHLWLAWLAFHGDDAASFSTHAAAWLAGLDSYPFLVLRPTLFGPRDPQTLAPLLLRARDEGLRPDTVRRLLNRLRLPLHLTHHPGFALKVQMLGDFSLMRGGTPVSGGEWRRKKAQQLLQLLLIHRQQFLQREQIFEHLWPQSDPAAAENQFKVTLNALQGVLEPQRPRGAPSFFILRQDSAYGLNPAAAIDLDVDRFSAGVQAAAEVAAAEPGQAIDLYRRALGMYQGPFLADALYEDWAAEMRAHLQGQFLQAAEVLARLLLAVDPAEAVQWTQRILAIDPAWEPAYRLAMRAHATLGQRHLLAHAYQQCIDNLNREMDLPPMPETTRLYHALVHGLAPAEPWEAGMRS